MKRQNYKNTKKGKRPDINNIYFRSSWEANIARLLNLLKKYNKIKDWYYENKEWFFPIKRGNNFYRSDFQIVLNDAKELYIEVKGFFDNRSRIKLKRMSKYFPNVSIILIGKKEYNLLKNKFQKYINNWE